MISILYGSKALEDILDDRDFWTDLGLVLALLMSAVSRRAVLEGIMAAQASGVIVDMDALQPEVLRIARNTSSRWWAVIEETTRNTLREALAVFIEQGLGRRGLPDLINAIEPLFDRARAERIASTEVTRLFAEGMKIAVSQDPAVGGLQWMTAKDERVCPICAPRDGMVWPKESAPVMPAHVRCRCAWAPASWDYIRRHRSVWQGALVIPDLAGIGVRNAA